MNSALDEFAASLPFRLDDFQIRAMEILESGRSVLVSAPTGSGKTEIANFGIFLSRQKKLRAFYTAPIKALSNQKYLELSSRFGVSNVGLLTGDTTKNHEASIVVMTTEVLRNMLFESQNLPELGLVVLDEIHYISDLDRGSVWEEILLSLNKQVQLVCLSATVSNYLQLARWISNVHGNMEAVKCAKRPVPVNYEIITELTRSGIEIAPLMEDRQLSKRARELVRKMEFEKKRRLRKSVLKPHLVEALEHLHKGERLPAIFFSFSRKECEKKAEELYWSGLRFTNSSDAKTIRSIADEFVTGLENNDLKALNYLAFREQLERGISYHHAGMIPHFKECVEYLFSRELVKIVFATETLATGVNLPARSVILDRLVKRTSRGRRLISPSEFFQLSGRAGRRGLDSVGYAIFIYDPKIDLRGLGSLTQNTDFAARSSFLPSYNTAINLYEIYGLENSKKLLEKSFAAFCSSRDIVADFQKRLEVLKMFGYLDDPCKSSILRRVHSDVELLISEGITRGFFELLSPLELVLSVGSITEYSVSKRNPGPKSLYRKDDYEVPEFLSEFFSIAKEINYYELRNKLPITRKPKVDMINLLVSFVKKRDLYDILSISGMAAGDFLRQIKMVVDVLDQLEELGSSSLKVNASKARSLLSHPILDQSSRDVNIHQFEGD